MKIYKYSLLIVSFLLFFSCEKETEGLSRVTYFVDLTLKGNPIEFVGVGETYKEPGWEALEGEEDVSDRVTVSGNPNTSKIGLYTLNYRVNNSDGIPKTASRQVVVCDITPSPLASGAYKVSKASNRTALGTGPGSAGSAEYASEPQLIVYQVSPGKFYISDFLGGYYEYGRGYGPTYAMTGHFRFNEDFTLSLVDSYVAGWKDGLMDFVNGKYNSATKTLSFTSQYAGSFDFNVIATKQ